MKKFCALILFTALLSCKSNTKQPVKTIGVDKTQQSIKSSLTIYQGVWVKSDYIDKIKKTKSVVKALDLVTGITALRIDPIALAGDSIKIGLSWDGHGDGIRTLKFKNGKTLSAHKFREFDLEYTIRDKDTSLILCHIYNGTLFKTVYHKILPVNPDENLSYGLSYAINKALIAGDYNLIGPAGKIEKVTFNNKGLVTGIPGFKEYSIESDMKYGPMENIDQLTFDSFASTQKTFAYVFNGDKLELYETKPNDKQTLIIRGKLKYTLIRTRD